MGLTGLLANTSKRKEEACLPSCDFDSPVIKGRGIFLCPDCGRNYSVEYLTYQKALEDESHHHGGNEPHKMRSHW